MEKVLIGFVSQKRKNIYTEEIVNNLSIGSSSQSPIMIEDLPGGPIRFHRNEDLFSVQFDDENWKINKKATTPNKLYLIDEETQLKCKDIEVTFKLMTESELDAIKDSTPVTRRKNIAEILGTMEEEELEESTPKPKKSKGESKIMKMISKIDKTARNFKLKKSSSKLELDEAPKIKPAPVIHYDYRPGGPLNFVSFLFNFSISYVFYYLAIPKLPVNIQEKIQLFENEIFQVTTKVIKDDYFAKYTDTIMSKLPIKTKDLPFDVILGTLREFLTIGILFIVINFSINLISSIILGRRPTHLLCGINIEGTFISKRIKSIIKEILSLVLFPLNFLNPLGILPIKSLPDMISRTRYEARSILIRFFGFLLTIVFSLLIFSLPYSLNFIQNENHQILNLGIIPDFPALNEGMSRTSLSFQLNNQSLELMMPEGSSITTTYSDEVGINIGSGEISVKAFPENINTKQLASIFLQGLPSSFAFYPALFFGPKLPYSSPLQRAIQGRRQQELSNTILYSLALGKKPKSLLGYLKRHGIFLYGASRVQQIITSKINLPVNGVVSVEFLNGVSYAFAMDKDKAVFFSSSPDISPNFIINFNGLKDRTNIIRSIIDQEGDSSSNPMGQMMKGLPSFMNK